MSAPSSSNNNGETAPKHARADRANETRLWKSRKANHAFQLSHSRDYYGLYNLLRDTDFEGKVRCTSNLAFKLRFYGKRTRDAQRAVISTSHPMALS